MQPEHLFRHVRNCIADGRYNELNSLSFTIPAHFNWVKEIFEGIHLQEKPEGLALIWTDGKVEENFTFKRLSIICNQFVNFLRKRGIREQGAIFSQIPLCPENWISILGTIKGGYRLIPAASTLSVQDIVYRFGKLLPEVVIADPDNAVKIDEAELLSGKNVGVKVIVNGNRDGWVAFEEIFLEEGEAEAANTLARDPLFLFFTSGTTGMPKIVTHDHTSYPIGHLTTASWIGLRKEDIHYNISQPGWAKFAWSSFFAPWSIGATIFSYQQTGRFDAARQLEMMERYGVSTFCSPPTALRMLILKDLSAYSFSLRECVAAGEPLNPEIIEMWKKGTGLSLRDGYGQTESTLMVANLPDMAIKPGSMGKPTFLYDILIADEEGRMVPDEEEGSITVNRIPGKTDGIFAGYFGDEARKKEVFRHGLYYTGDKAYRDRDGYIWFVGRDDDVIKTSDYRVGPFEVESILLEHEFVVESAVVASPHPVKGFIVKAFVVLNKDLPVHADTAKELFEFSRKNLAAYKVPRIFEFVDELPKTISGKIRRVELRGLEADRRARNERGEFEYFW